MTNIPFQQNLMAAEEFALLKHRSRRAIMIATLVCCQLCSVAVGAATRVALVSTCGGSAGADVLALAEAKLSADKEIALLERAMVERVVNEQKLTTCGLTDSKQALAVGKLLGVEVFVALETFPDSKTALGLVAFDADNGIKLWDAALPDNINLDQLADGIAAAVRAACEKRQRIAGGVRTVCLLAVRNADLPREMDSLCESVGLLLERQLLSSPGLAVLERRRLESVNRERLLPSNAPVGDLFPSVVVIELEVSRAQGGDGIAATALLTDGAGKPMNKATTRAAEKNAATLVQSLALAIATELKVVGMETRGDRAREAERFHQQAKLLWNYGEHFRALETAEAACALEPNRVGLKSALARSLITCGIELIRPGGERVLGPFTCKATGDDICRSLALAERGLTCVAEIQRATVNTGRIERDEMQENLSFALDYSWAYVQDILQIHQPGSQQVFARTGWNIVCLPLQTYLTHGAADRIDQAIKSCNAIWRSAESDRVTRSILELYRTCELEAGGIVAQRLKAHSPQLDALDDLLVKFLDDQPRLSPEQIRERLRKIRLFGQDSIAEAKSKHLDTLCLRMENHVGEILDPSHSTGAAYDECAAFCEFLLQERELPLGALQELTWFPAYLPHIGVDEHRRWLRIMDRILELLDSSDCRLEASQREHLRARTEYYRGRLLQMRSTPELTSPWSAARVLFDVFDAGDGVLRFFSPRVRDGVVYLMGFGKEEASAQIYFQLLRCSLSNPGMDYLGKIVAGRPQLRFATKSRSRAFGLHDPVHFASACDDGHYFSSPPDGSGVWVFPTSGGAATRITTGNGLPSDEVDSLACLDGTLYAGLHDGYLIAYDLATKRCDVLASSRRKDKLSPFDDGLPFSVPYMVSDPHHHRIVFLAAGPWELNSPNPTAGLWEFDPISRRFKKLLPLVANSSGVYWGSDVAHGQFILRTDRGCMRFDLRNNTATVLARYISYFPPGADIFSANASKTDQPASRLMNRWREFDPPLMVYGDWLWSAMPWGRYSLDGQRQEAFTSLRPDNSTDDVFFPTECLETVGEGNQVIVGDQYTLWLLTLPTVEAGKSP